MDHGEKWSVLIIFLWRQDVEDPDRREITLLLNSYNIFTRSDGELFMKPEIVHQEETYTQDLHYKIP